MKDPAADLEYVRQKQIGNCERCSLCKHRRRVVFGEGNPQADIMFVGEAPGGQEDQLGRPFVGPAGGVLNQWLADAGIKRQDVYIANVTKCRPRDNRDPFEHEIEECSRFLKMQLFIIRPKVIVALGRISTAFFLGHAPMREIRGVPTPWEDEKIKLKAEVVPTYHPSFVLRRGDSKQTAEYQEAVSDVRAALLAASG